MNWLDTETKELLQQTHDEKLAPSRTVEFALVLLLKGSDRKRLIDAIIEINKCSEASAVDLAHQSTPVAVNRDLTQVEALWGQFELICCDAVAIYLRTEVLVENERSYLWPLFKRVSESPEFRMGTVTVDNVPATRPGEKFLEQFLGSSALKRAFPMTFTMPFKKARIMEHWAARIDARIRLEFSDAEG